MFRCKNCGMGNTTVEEHVVEGDDVLLKEFCKDCGAFTYHSLCRVVSTLNQSLISVAGARVPNTCSECRFLESNACEFDRRRTHGHRRKGRLQTRWREVGTRGWGAGACRRGPRTMPARRWGQRW